MAKGKIPVNNDGLLQANIISLANDVAHCYLTYIKNVKDKKAAHHYRVAVKKIKCVQEVSKMLGFKIFNKIIFKKYRLLFKVTGKLREWNLLKQSYLAFAGKNSSIPFIVTLHKKESKAVLQIEKVIYKSGNWHRLELVNRAMISQLEYKYFHNYYLQQMQQNTQLLTGAVTKNKKWHRLRKQLKRCIYLAEIINKAPNKALVDLQKLLGKWHDAEVHLHHVEWYLNKNKNQQAATFKKKILKKRKKLTGQIKDGLAKNNSRRKTSAYL